jgi:PPM family protein phosphatase
VSVRLVIGASTDVGRVRDHNEDGYIIDEGLALVAVADGMGGHRGGEVASATALEAFYASFSADGGLHDAVVAANEAVNERAADDEELRGMGTTLTAGVLGEDGTMIIGHVGDSRAYLLRGGDLSRVTTDHSLVEELMAAGELTAEEAEHDPRRSMITRGIGLDTGVDVDMYPVALEVGDRLVLCSDGLNSMVSEADIKSILIAESDPERAASALVDAANAAGGVDNTTVIVIDVAEGNGDATQPIPEAPVAEPVEETAAEAEPKRRRGFLRRRK